MTLSRLGQVFCRRGVMLSVALAAVAFTAPAAHAQRGTRAARTPSAPVIMPSACRDTIGAESRAPRGPMLTWNDGAVPWATWSVRLGEKRVPVTVVVARIDPTRVSLALAITTRGDAIGPWTLDAAPADAAIAFNAGQFTDGGPWGWVVHRGREWQGPGAGALGAAVVIDSTRVVRIVPADSIASWRSADSRRRTVLEAVQSYPHLLQDGRLPTALCRVGAIDRGHRDIRLGIGVRADGQVIVALTRYAPPKMLPDATQRLPIGPTTLEMAEIMLQLGSRDAVLLDGGLSAQLRVGHGATKREWPGLRAVPLAVVGIPR